MAKSFILNNFGQKLKAVRELRGLTQTDLGKKIGVGWQRVSAYENGADISLDTVFKLAEILNWPPLELLKSESEQPEFMAEFDYELKEALLLARLIRAWNKLKHDTIGRGLILRQIEGLVSGESPLEKLDLPSQKKKA